MDRKIKERLIGLVVLLTLAVIFLPVFLGGPEESGERRRLPLANDTEESLPETRLDLNGSESAASDEGDPVSASSPADERGDGDDVTVTGLDESVEDAASAADSDAGATNGEARDDAPDETEATPVEEASPADTAESSGDSASTDAGTDESETESSTQEPSHEPEGSDGESADDEPADADAVPAGSGWAAQVGSFTHRDNADDLINQLRDEGFEAFLMRHRTDDRTFYRVRVGLEPDRESAVSLAERIHRETGHEAAPVPHP